MELYKKHRPAKLTEIVGQADVVAFLEKRRKGKEGFPQAMLLVGPSGCGKTTVARIIADLVHCGEEDYFEMNAADSRGVDSIREIRRRMSLAPISGLKDGRRMYVIDEAHQLTKDAQSALLKMLEDPPKHVHFVLCTTNGGEIIQTIQTRCTILALSALSVPQMESLLERIAKAEGLQVGDEVREKIIDVAEGSARKALVLLDQLRGCPEEEEQLGMIAKADAKSQTKQLCQALCNPTITWPQLAKIIKTLDEDPERIRRAVLGYFSAILLGGGKLSSRAALILAIFRDNWYDCGRAGLISSCWEIVSTKK